MTIAVIGLGSIGTRHAGNLLQLGESVCGFDPDPMRRELLVKAGGKVADSRDQALKGAECAIICSPNQYHLADLQAALDHGCHTLVEKPLAHTTAGVQETIDRAHVKNLTVAIAMNLRFHPITKKVKKFLDMGIIGKVIWARFLCSSYLPNWRPHQDYRVGYTTDPVSGGVLFDIIHEIDLSGYLLGMGKVEAAVARRSGAIDTSAEDCADLIFSHADGVHSSLHLDYVSRNAQRYFEIQGENGFIKGDLMARHTACINAEGKTIIDETFPGSFAEDYIEEMKSFLAAIRGKGGQICPATEAFSVLKTVMEARRQAGLVIS